MPRTISITKAPALSLDVVIPAFAFIIPFVLSGPQWLTGSIINCLLFLSSGTLSKKSRAAVIVLPSIGALSHGILFGQFTPFLIYFLPFIWVGNFLLTYIFKETKNYGYPIRVVTSSVIKSVLLFSIATLYLRFSLVPKLFVTSMGILQLVTAIAGGILLYTVAKLMNIKYE